MKKNILLSCVVLISFLWLNSAPAQMPRIEGRYSVQGTNPRGMGSYRGTADIVKAGDSYRIHWSVGTVYDGVGKLNGNVFQVEWGTTKEHVGTVTYVLQADGVLKGTWYVEKNPNDLGTEILTPKK